MHVECYSLLLSSLFLPCPTVLARTPTRCNISPVSPSRCRRLLLHTRHRGGVHLEALTMCCPPWRAPRRGVARGRRGSETGKDRSCWTCKHKQPQYADVASGKAGERRCHDKQGSTSKDDQHGHVHKGEGMRVAWRTEQARRMRAEFATGQPTAR